jgi:hypothetical protein
MKTGTKIEAAADIQVGDWLIKKGTVGYVPKPSDRHISILEHNVDAACFQFPYVDQFVGLVEEVKEIV